MVPDYSCTIMSLVTIVLHVKRVLTNDKDELTQVYEMVSKLQYSGSQSVLAHNDDGLSIDIHMYACLAKLSLIQHKQCLTRITRRSKISFFPPHIY